MTGRPHRNNARRPIRVRHRLEVYKGIAMKNRFFVLFSALLLGLPLAAQAGESLEDVEKALEAKWEKIKSMSTKLDVTQDLEMYGMSIKSESKGTSIFMRDGDKIMSRTEMEGTSEQSMGGTPMKQETEMIMVDDGEHAYTYTHDKTTGQKQAMKTESGTGQSQFGAEYFDQMRESFDLKILPEEEVRGDACYVIEGKPSGDNQQMAQAIARMVHFYRKSDGALMQLTGFSPDGKEVMKQSFTEIKINGSIDKDKFVFKAPEGVQVMDMTGGGMPMPGGGYGGGE